MKSAASARWNWIRSKLTPCSERGLHRDEVKRLRVMDFEPAALAAKSLQWSDLREEATRLMPSGGYAGMRESQRAICPLAIDGLIVEWEPGNPEAKSS